MNSVRRVSISALVNVFHYDESEELELLDLHVG